MLPLGRRVQEKLEVLIDKHMYQLGESFPSHFSTKLTMLGASKVSLSSISSEELWAKSGRIANVGSEVQPVFQN